MRSIKGRPRLGPLTRWPALKRSALGDIDIGTSRRPPGDRIFLRIITALRSGDMKLFDLEVLAEVDVPAPPLVPWELELSIAEFVLTNELEKVPTGTLCAL